MNDKKEILQRIYEICAENGINVECPERLQEEVDSLQYISVLVAMEKYFGIMFPDHVLEKNMFENLDELVDVIEEETKKICQADAN